jgi:hypothetical protein
MEDKGTHNPKPVLVLPAPPANKDPKPVARLTKDELIDYTESELVRHARKVVPRLFKNIERRLDADDPKAVDQAAQMYGYIKAGPGIALNILQQNNNYNVESSAGFEKIVRQLEKSDRPEHDVDVIDAEVVEDTE